MASNEPRLAPPGLRVLQIVPAEVHGRFGRMVREVALGLLETTAQIEVLTDDPTLAAALQDSPVEVRKLAALSGWRAWRLGGLLRDLEPPDVVHLWGVEGIATFSEYAQRSGAALLIQVTARREIARLVAHGRREGEHMTAMCRALADELRDCWTPTPVDVPVLPPALLEPRAAAPAAPRDSTLGMVWTGWLDEPRELDVVLDAVQRLHAREIDFQLALIGRGPVTHDVWRQVGKRGLQSCVTLIDEPTLWDRALYGADVLLVPVDQDDISLAPLLAMALGRIVIASRQQTADWFIDGQTALLFEPGSADALLARLLLVLERHPSVLALGRAAANFVRERHSLSALAEQQMRLYGAMLDARGAVHRARIA